MCNTIRKSVSNIYAIFKRNIIIRLQLFAIASALLVENGNFSWGDEETVLKDINMRVETGQLTAVVGTVGSGE